MAINLEMACGKSSCFNPFACKTADCDFGDAVRNPNTRIKDCANNGGCNLETGKTPGCLVAYCPRAELIAMGQEIVLPSDKGRNFGSVSNGSIEFTIIRQALGV